jgi:hypothetical protein
MSSDCIVTQGHIPEFDPQGHLTAEQKRHLFDISLYHLRYNNPDTYIILTGHGVTKPDTSMCDFCYWEDECRPMSDAGYVIDMPAQYFFVDVGIQHAIEMGFTHCLKTRTDCVIQRENIINWCEYILADERKYMLLTQQTGENRIGDCFMYGSTEALHSIWNQNNPVHHPDGLINTAVNFKQTFHYHHDSWMDYLREYTSFVDVIDIPFLCLRWNYHMMMREKEVIDLCRNELSVDRYHWGRANDWHIFDSDGNMPVRYNGDFWCRKEFYGAGTSNS